MLLYCLFTTYAFIPLFARICLSRAPFPFPGLVLKLLAFVFGMSQPVRYMVSPPTAPAWDELVVEDERGVKRPRGGRGSGEVERGIGASWVVGFVCEVGVMWSCWLS